MGPPRVQVRTRRLQFATDLHPSCCVEKDVCFLKRSTLTAPVDQAVSREAGADRCFPPGAPAHPTLACRKLVPLRAGLPSDPGHHCALPEHLFHNSLCVAGSQHPAWKLCGQGAASRPKGASPGGTPQYLGGGNLPCGKGNTEPHRIQSRKERSMNRILTHEVLGWKTGRVGGGTETWLVSL